MYPNYHWEIVDLLQNELLRFYHVSDCRAVWLEFVGELNTIRVIAVRRVGGDAFDIQSLSHAGLNITNTKVF
jgi:hypothetical protein